MNSHSSFSSHPVSVKVSQVVTQLRQTLQDDTSLTDAQREAYLKFTHKIESLMSSE